MGVNWGMLAKLGAVGAAPFTGGTSLALLPAIEGIGRVAGNAAKGASDQRMAQNQQSIQHAASTNRDMLERASLANANQNSRAGMTNEHNQFSAGLDLQRKNFLQNEPNVQARQALTGSLMSRIQPMRAPSGFEQRPSILDAIGPEAREAGGLLAQRGLSGLKNPTQFDAMPGVSLPDVLNMPPAMLAQVEKSGMLEKSVLAGAGYGATRGLEEIIAEQLMRGQMAARAKEAADRTQVDREQLSENARQFDAASGHRQQAIDINERERRDKNNDRGLDLM